MDSGLRQITEAGVGMTTRGGGSQTAPPPVIPANAGISKPEWQPPHSPRHSRERGNLSLIRPTNVVESATVPPWAIRSPPRHSRVRTGNHPQSPRHSLTPPSFPRSRESEPH